MEPGAYGRAHSVAGGAGLQQCNGKPTLSQQPRLVQGVEAQVLVKASKGFII
jgi:hypothetical protein